MKSAKAKKLEVPAVPEILKLNLGCGKTVMDGFEGADSRDFGQKHKLDLTKTWPWKDESVDEAHSSHFVEHLDVKGRIHFANELYRVLRVGAKCLIITPNWSSARAYGDLTHQWPPVSEFWFLYLNKGWREVNAPHNDFYTCDFDSTGGWSLHQAIVNRNQEYQMHALTFWKEAGPDLITTLTKNR
jgi:hypothetical protein